MDLEWLDPEKVDKRDARQFLVLLRHLKAYEFADRHIDSGTRILEIGSGAGYGAKILSKKAESIICTDVSHDALKLARMRNDIENIHYLLANPIKRLPFPDECFNLVILFQVIEHIDPSQVHFFLKEIRRVKASVGKVLISTPNRTLRLLPFQKPWNKYHKKEYSHRTLRKILKKVFTNMDVYGLIAKDEIIELERISVKQDPLLFYMRSLLVEPFIKYLPISFVNLVKGPVRLIKMHKEPLSDAQKKIKSHFAMSMNDLYFSKTESRKVLDFMAICTD